ncbi:alkane hydroxylase MAH1-like [Impatiens glandulifera]|uniref:alkane hydroxylase MAH1-like n=1 Tax=Impatiens glandulifera TaxID=253017 RepID=UPI001FB128F7|nr:alkane hydroxylase MAH1-like [Impatiens glandulifera]
MALLLTSSLEILMGVLLLLLALFLRKNARKFHDDRIPVEWPILGMLPGLFQEVHRIHDRCVEVFTASGGTFLFKGPRLARLDMLATADPANIHYIMSSNFHNFPKGPLFLKMFDFLGGGIFNSDYDDWRFQRKLARLLLTHRRFNRFLAKTSFDKVENGLIPILEMTAARGSVVDLQDVFQRLTFDTTCTLVTGYDPGCLSPSMPDVPFSKAMDDAEEAVFLRHVVPESVWRFERWVGIGPERKLKEACRVLDSVIGRYIAMKREALGERNVNKGGGGGGEEKEGGVDLLTSYLLQDDETMENVGLTNPDDKFLRDTILNLMIAGRDTTSSALTWFIWLVSNHPDIQTKIRDELESVLPVDEKKQESRKWHIFKADELNKLTYLHAAMCESLRLYPPVPFEHKEAAKPDILPSGHKVDPNVKVLISLYAMGRMEFIWGEDCSKFKPERWISEKGTIKHEPSYKFMAFNAGPRTCLGKEVAFTQMKVVASAIIHNYEIETVKGHNVEPNCSIILYMKHGFKVKVSRRSIDRSNCKLEHKTVV